MPGVSTGLLGEGPAAQILGGPALVEINPQGAGGRGLVQMAPASTGGGVLCCSLKWVWEASERQAEKTNKREVFEFCKGRHVDESADV